MLVISFWRIVKKTGSSGFNSIFLYIPFVNIIFIIFSAFGSWPIEEELRKYKETFGPLPEPEEDEDMKTCPNCKTPIPDGAETCVACGYPKKVDFKLY